jgi:hypothetical protein
MSKFNKNKTKQAKKTSVNITPDTPINIQKALKVISELAIAVRKQLSTEAKPVNDDWVYATAAELSAVNNNNETEGDING